MKPTFSILAVVLLIAGCAGGKTDRQIAQERAATYLTANPGLDAKTAAAIKANEIHNGMTMEQVVAAWGRPAVVQKFRGGEAQYWYFGCDYPHFCNPPPNRFPVPDDIYQSKALFNKGVVTEWDH